jgi:cyclic-di-AMP phosphodiesterase PgpH
MAGKLKQTFVKENADNLIRWGLLFLLTGLFTFVLYPSLAIKRHIYQLGDVADKNIKATEDFFIEDKAATDTKRQEAGEAALTVYDHDQLMASRLMAGVSKSFSMLKSVFNAPPPVEIAPDEITVVLPDAETKEAKPTEVLSPTEEKASKRTPEDRAWLLKSEFESALGLKVSQGAYSILVQQKFNEDIPNIINKIVKEILDKGVVSNKEILLKEIDKGITLRSVQSKTEQTVTALRGFYGLDQAKTMVRVIGDPLLKDFNYNLRNLIVDLVQELITPNITLNRNETEERKKLAADDIKPILYQIKTGEMIIREGERVTPIQLKKLNAMHSEVKKENAVVNGLGAAMIVMCFLAIFYRLYVEDNKRSSLHLKMDLLFFASVLVSLFFVAKLSMAVMDALTQSGTFAMPARSAFFGMPIASGTMLVCLFLGLNSAVLFGILIAAFITVLFQNHFELFIYFFLNSVLAAYWIQQCRERKVFIQAGAKLGLLNVLLVTAIHLYGTELSIVKLLWDWAFAFSGGIIVGVISLGMAPLIEMVFGYKTDVTLLELANLDRPILRRLMLEAPGTYHHSVVVGTMVEAAAAEIGANSLKAKVCGYYHDIGKINKPLYFIENQSNGKNKHDKLAPSMSALILISHIKDGVEIARSHKLGQEIIDVIRQHHGTSLISFFYDRAKQQKGEDAVDIENFRYKGPTPQTREAGLVMLADVVEAASRTLDDPTPSRIQKLVQNLINKIFSDGQLGNCELTLRDLHQIAKSFIIILTGIHHHRIEYPDSPATSNGKGKNGSPDRQQSRSEKHSGTGPSKDGDTHLKRLGLP